MSEARHGPIDPALLGEDCPSRRILRVVGDKWTPVLLYCLSTGTWRFSDLQRAIPDISRKVLTSALRRLEAEGLAQRTAYPGKMPMTDYRLTELGQRLHEPIAALCRWAEANPTILERLGRP